ncbi:hypothetical protein AALK14_00035 [Butyricimonas hominis]|mgnify:FL=1|uniref:hypothetical protein n=1 Tax=Butyricimonas hominis TaxID=2763032 RepID=UPI0035193D9B
MNKRMGHLIIITLLSTIVLATGSCDRHGAAWDRLDMAESLMKAQPDSALAVLESIPTSDIKGKETSARYALLKSMALDKNCIDMTTFDVLQPSIDYYIEHGSPDDQLRTYYYQGRIYQNQGDDDSAMRSFMNCSDLRQRVTDTLLMAHTLVAQGMLYLKQYKINEFVQNNMEAAKLYGAIGRDLLEIKSYTNAIDGYIMLNDKSASDSLLSVCVPLVQKNTDGEAYLFPSLLSYTVEFCSSKEIREALSAYQNRELTPDETMIYAHGYSKIGEFDKALTLLSEISPSASTWDSLKYASVKIDIFEKQGKYEQAFTLYRDYSAILERQQKELLSQDLLFSDKKHKLEMKNLMDIRDKDRIIGGTLCGIFALVILIGWLYYRDYLSRTKRILAEKENENLRLEQDNLRKEKEKAELERDKKTLETENLEKDKKRLEAEKRQHELETANLKLEIAQLESERDNLKELQRVHTELAMPIQAVIKNRLKLLNGLLAKEITNNESYAEPYNKWIETIHNDKKNFMDSTRLAFAASHPKLMEYLEEHGLSTDEINYLCLYAIGLRGKEVGEYTQIKRHYIISHEIRKKLGIDEHETNIGHYIRRLMKDFE